MSIQLDLFGLPAEQTQAPATIPVRSYSRRAKAAAGRKAKEADFDNYYDAMERVQKYLHMFYPFWKSSRQVAEQAPCPDRWVLKALAALKAETEYRENGLVYFRLARAGAKSPETVGTPAPSEYTPLPHNGTETSKAASVAVAASGDAQADRARVLECIRVAGKRGITRADICNQTGLSGDTVRPRVWELMGQDKKKAFPALVEVQGKRIPDCGGRLSQEVLVVKEGSEARDEQ
jgi:hypothetical protein